MIFSALLRRSATLYGDRPAVVFEGRTQTYAELWDRSCRLANALGDLGLRPGDRVATLGDNGFESLETICALALAGTVRSPLYAQNTSETHLYMLDTVAARALIVQDSFLSEVEHVLAQARTLEHVIVVGDRTHPSQLDYESLLADAAPVPPHLSTLPTDPYIIRFSAGTTGKPKGVVHSEAGWSAMGDEFAAVLPRINEDDRFLVAGPLSHAACLLMWPLIAGGGCHVVMRKFDPGEFIELVDALSCTMSLLVPTMIQMVVHHPDAEPLRVRSLRAVFYGAAPITERTLEEAHALWGAIMYQLYGQSESPAIAVLDARYHDFGPSSARRKYLRAAGTATPRNEIAIIADDGTRLALGSTGEVCVRGPGTMSGIWGDPEASGARFTSDGYLRTRDVGHLDEDGFLFLSDRKEDLIISGGFNVWPAEVENVLCAHAAVLEAAVVGVPDDKWGETVFAVVVLREGATATEQDLIAWCRGRLGAVKKPTRVEFSQSPLPKSPVGKLLRRAVRAQYWTGEDRAVRGA